MAPNRLKTLYGVGVMNYGEYSSLTHPKAYKTWSGMIERCYSTRFLEKQPTYRNCTVDPEWHNFQNFVPWFEANYVEGYHLDKDLLVLGNTIYSDKTCVFIPRWLNNILLDSQSSRGALPIGVSYLYGKYRARFSCKGRSEHLGLFASPELAYAAYCKAKGAYLVAMAEVKEVPDRIKSNLVLLGHQLLGGVTCR